MDEKLTRWIWASITKFIDSKRQSIQLILEGDDVLIQNKDSFTLRINGPIYTEPSKDYFVIDVGINVLVTSIKDEADAHKVFRLCGIISRAYENQISVYKYGDDNSFVGCLIRQDKIIITQFGAVEASTNVLQSTVESEYKMQLKGA